MKGRAMTNADQIRAYDTDQGSPKPLWKRQDEERRRIGPALTDAQRDELKALGHQLLNPRSD
jgi:hypothetical protein